MLKAIDTRAPSGLTITRNKNVFTFAWKITEENYGEGHRLQWRFLMGDKWQPWVEISILPETKEKTIYIDPAQYWPQTKRSFSAIEFRVRGKRAMITQNGITTWFNWSTWSKCRKILYVPYIPLLSEELDSTYDNVTEFTWDTTYSDTDNRYFRDVEWQSIVAKESNIVDGSKLAWNASVLGWQKGSGAASGSYSIQEDTERIAQISNTRWFRVRSRGPSGTSDSQGKNGCSKWRYAKHVYAIPWTPRINSVKWSENWVRINWTADQSPSHPIDFTYIEWAIGVPRADLNVPVNPSWNTVRTYKDTPAGDEAFFLVDQQLGLDECIWVRVSVQHDRNRRDTGAYLAGRGDLTAPTGLSVQVNSATFRATIHAENNSDVPDSKLAVIFRSVRNGQTRDAIIGITTAGSGQKEITVQCPEWSESETVSFGVCAFQGAAEPKTSGACTIYAIKAHMLSAELWDGGAVPVAPTGCNADATETQGEAILAWDWTWNQANRAEISWSQNINAWESTEEPETYIVTNLHAAQWRVSGLETGAKWYFRIRLAQQLGEEITYGPYCRAMEVDLSSAPSIPVLSLSNNIVTEGEDVTASWAYFATDGTAQANAEVCEVTIGESGITYGDIIAHATTAQHATIPNTWQLGSTHIFCVRVYSESGRVSGWSDPVPVTVAEPIECTITNHSLERITIGTGDDERDVLALQSMPLSVTITGAGEGGTTTLIVERSAEYHMIRPDESIKDGFEGETIILFRQNGENEIIISQDNLIGLFDDGAPYRLIATVEDDLGQSASKELEFEVHWTHQADMPAATVRIIDEAAIITPIAPLNASEGDVCDIYRLSADLPELIVEGAEYGTEYVDPYPAIGRSYGHRIVDRTVNGDYITEDGRMAWLDLGVNDDDVLEIDNGIIDFDGMQLQFQYNAKVSNTWSKDFVETKYLGGSVTGDWNPTVSRTSTINGVLVSDDEESRRILRRLAEYSGICHVRTPEGSSYSANVQVSENMGFDTAGKLIDITLTITRIDPDDLDGVTFERWIGT